MPMLTERFTFGRFAKGIKVGSVIVLGALSLIASYTQASITVPSNNLVFFQTTGEQANIDIGDYYTNVGGDNIHHLVEIHIPCVPNITFRIELFDPELYDAAGEAVNDELRGAGDQTNYLLWRPNNTPVGTTTVYGPYAQPPAAPPPEHDNWVEFQTITLPAVPQEGVDCGTYTIEVWTGNESGVATDNNDDNAWRYRLMGGAGLLGTETFDSALGPDGRAGTGDEAWLGLQRLSYQLNSIVTQSFYWFVDDDGSLDWVGRNFDVDNATLCGGNCSVNYLSPTMGTFPGTVGNSAQWNPGQVTRGPGDPHSEEPGLWRADITVDEGNQYIFEVTNGGKPIFPDPPILPNLTINKDDGATVVSSPGTTTYTLTLTNTGPGAAMPIAGPEVVDTLPAGMTFASCTVNSPLVGTCTSAGNLININLVPQTQALNSPGLTPFGPILAYLPASGSGLVNSGTITVTVNVAAGIAGGTSLDNVAAVDWSDVYDNNYRPVSDNDVDTVQAAPQVSADLAVSKIDLADPVTAGSNVTYQITVTNLGPDTAVGAVLTDSIPAGTTFVSASAGCGAAGATVTCNLGDIASPGSVVVNVTVATGSAGVITDTASVTSNTPDPVPGNNNDPEDTTVIGPVPTQIVPTQFVPTQVGVVPSLDPTISKRADPPFALPGDTITWTITISNPGSSAATNVVVTDTLPGEVVIVSVSSSSGSVTFSGQSVTFTQAVLGPGESVSIEVLTRLREDVVPPYSLHNLASLTNAENPNPRYAQASVVGASGLPATGESPWSRWRTPLFALGLIASGLAVLSLARRRWLAR